MDEKLKNIITAFGDENVDCDVCKNLVDKRIELPGWNMSEYNNDIVAGKINLVHIRFHVVVFFVVQSRVLPPNKIMSIIFSICFAACSYKILPSSKIINIMLMRYQAKHKEC